VEWEDIEIICDTPSVEIGIMFGKILMGWYFQEPRLVGNSLMFEVALFLGTRCFGPKFGKVLNRFHRGIHNSAGFDTFLLRTWVGLTKVPGVPPGFFFKARVGGFGKPLGVGPTII